MKSYEELIVYQRSMDLVVDVYKLTGVFPKTETYALADQLKRATVSIPSNISEGFDRKSSKEFLQFLTMAFTSSSEVSTQLDIAYRLEYISRQNYLQIKESLNIIRKMLRKLISSIKQKILVANH